jgi:hypothetical protein
MMYICWFCCACRSSRSAACITPVIACQRLGTFCLQLQMAAHTHLGLQPAQEGLCD